MIVNILICIWTFFGNILKYSMMVFPSFSLNIFALEDKDLKEKNHPLNANKVIIVHCRVGTENAKEL